MDKLLIFRALGVPDIIKNEENREKAAVWRLAVLAHQPLEPVDIRSGERQYQIHALLQYGVEQAATGRLDGLLGGFESAERTVDGLARSAPPSGYDVAVTFLTPLVGAIVAFVEAHPFTDDSGRYFA